MCRCEILNARTVYDTVPTRAVYNIQCTAQCEILNVPCENLNVSTMYGTV